MAKEVFFRMSRQKLRKMLGEAYMAGWEASGPEWNSITDHYQDGKIRTSAKFLEEKDGALTKMIHQAHRHRHVSYYAKAPK